MLIIKNISLCFFVFFSLFLLAGAFIFGSHPYDKKSLGKVLICGVCRNIEFAVPNTIANIEELGAQFDDYAVIIYENNSTDRTASLLSQWTEHNPRILCVSETLPEHALPPHREQRIARARNLVLSLAKDEKYKDFEHLIMVDLDFVTPWPIDEIVVSTQIKGDWDCISANGVFYQGLFYWDRYAFRNADYPFGPELIGPVWWERLFQSWFGMPSNALIPVYSGFGGLAIYKRSTIIQFTYSGVVTEDLQKYYARILSKLPVSNSDLNKYLEINKLQYNCDVPLKPIIFQSMPPSDCSNGYKDLACCEHVTLHASMALNNYGKFYINSRLLMRYSH